MGMNRAGILSRWVLSLALLATTAAEAQRIPQPGGFNLFSKDQDVQLGQEASAEIEKEVTLVDNAELSAYIEGIGKRLAAAPEAEGYPYTFKVVNDESINAFALPGGPTYVNTGLILAAENEAQLAGVMGHEISHVALRHGTKQASRGQIFSLGAMLGGSVVGSDGMLGQLAQLGIGLGANSVLLKYSRSFERDADLLGARIMARAGYNPIEASRFFEKLEAETGSRSGIEAFFSSHPNPGNRSDRIEQELPYMPAGPYDGDTGQLARMQNIIKGLPPPPEAPSAEAAPTPAPIEQGTAPPPPAEPSGRWSPFRGRAFTLVYPENWQAIGSDDGLSVTLVPQGGFVQTQGGNAIGRGALARFVSVRGGANLDRDTDALVQQIRQANPGMQTSGRPARQMRVAGRAALLTTLYSDSPYGTGREIDLLLTVSASGGLYYMLFITPESELRLFQPSFEQMMQSVQLGR